MTPSGPHFDDTSSAGASNSSNAVRSSDNTNITGSLAGCQFSAPDRGSRGITVWPTGEPEKTTTLPGIAGRYEKGDGLVYILPTSWGGTYKATAEEVARGLAFAKIGETAAADWSKKDPHRLIWHTVADTWPVTPPSPRVTEGTPPLAPVFAPAQDDEDAARAGWAAMADRLTPTGRWVVGLALMSPWIDRTGATSSIVSLWGEAGEGKSLLAQVCSGLFGIHNESPAQRGLFGTFDSSAQGIKATAQDLAYFPMILDEAQAATGDVEAQMRALVMGADRSRANRSGSAVTSAARWGGLAIVTGNSPLDLIHEMFTRRLIEVQVCDLWADVPPVDAWSDRAAYWAQIAQRDLPVMDGWPWLALTRSYTPGTLAAQQIITAAHAVPIPGSGNLGLLGQLAVVGAQWLAQWTGSDTWTDGVWEAGADLIAARAAEAPSPARDAATQIIDDMAVNPGAWTSGSDFDAHGFPADDLTGKVCDCNHDEAHCTWINVYSRAFSRIVDTPLARLGRTGFRRSLYVTEGDHLTRKVRRISGARPRAVTVCIDALAAIAEPPHPHRCPTGAPTVPDLPTPAQQELPDFPVGDPDPFQVAAAARQDDRDDRDDEEEPEVHVFDWTTGTDIDAELTAAHAAGTTDLVVPNGWPIQHAAAWDAHDWHATGGSGRVYGPDGASIRVWAWDSKRVSAEDACTALRTFRETTGHNDFISVPTLGHTIAMNYGKGADGRKKKKAPRWLLPDEQADIWQADGVKRIATWGDIHADGVTSYDRNRAFLPAIRQARLAPLYRDESYEHHGSDAPVGRQWAGLYRIIVPTWDSPLPPPHGILAEGTEAWVSGEVMGLYADLDMTVTITEAWLAPTHTIPHIEHLYGEVTRWLEDFDDPTRIIPKKIYQSFAGSMRSAMFRDRAYRIYRPDWSAAIEQNAWCAVLRQTYRTYETDNRYIPVAVNVDAVKYPSGLPTPPGFTIGTGLGQYKIEG